MYRLNDYSSMFEQKCKKNNRAKAIIERITICGCAFFNNPCFGDLCGDVWSG